MLWEGLQNKREDCKLGQKHHKYLNSSSSEKLGLELFDTICFFTLNREKNVLLCPLWYWINESGLNITTTSGGDFFYNTSEVLKNIFKCLSSLHQLFRSYWVSLWFHFNILFYFLKVQSDKEITVPFLGWIFWFYKTKKTVNSVALWYVNDSCLAEEEKSRKVLEKTDVTKPIQAKRLRRIRLPWATLSSNSDPDLCLWTEECRNTDVSLDDLEGTEVPGHRKKFCKVAYLRVAIPANFAPWANLASGRELRLQYESLHLRPG